MAAMPKLDAQTETTMKQVFNYKIFIYFYFCVYVCTDKGIFTFK